MDTILRLLTPRNIIDLLLASGFIAQLLPPVNRLIGRIVSNRYGRIAMDVAEAMEDGKLTEAEVRAIITGVYRSQTAESSVLDS